MLCDHHSLATHLALPDAEIMAFQDYASPHFNESHRRFLLGMKAFVQRELEPIATEKDRTGAFPGKALKQTLGMNGVLVSRIGPGPWMDVVEELGIKLPGGVTPAEFDCEAPARLRFFPFFGGAFRLNSIQ